jgi:outer membrane translocation and assembly module TamA
LQKRIENLEEQSLKIHLDISARVQTYLRESGTNSSAFVLPLMFHPRCHQKQGKTFNTEFQRVHEFGLVQEEALHYWVQRQMGFHHTFSYQQLQRVCSQLRKYHPVRFGL